MANAIQTTDLTVKLGTSFELRGLDLNVPEGSVYGFLGPNGSGKSTTIRMLMGMMKPDAGEIRLLGAPIPESIERVLARTGYVPERPHLYPALTIGETLAYHAAFFSAWDERWATEMLGRLGLERGRKVGRLSKGETGKLMILLALYQRPDLLILDEPTDGLDPVVRRDVMSAVMDYVAEAGATVFISSHLVHELERMCDWVGVIDGGRLIAEMPMDAFKNEIKRLHVVDPPAALSAAPFEVLSRTHLNGHGPGESWVVRGWREPMRELLESAGAHVRDVQHLDLEDGFVELLRSGRRAAEEE
ncbi:MAG: ABC transporter ATP-binding protein [Gemmatimonadota bacterium]